MPAKINIIDIVPKDVFVSMEFSVEAIECILNYLEKSIVLYSKVYSDAAIDDSLSVAEDFKHKLTSVMKMLKKETEDDS